MAEREGFEPPVPLRVLRISSAVRSTTLPPLRGGGRAPVVRAQYHGPRAAHKRIATETIIAREKIVPQRECWSDNVDRAGTIAIFAPLAPGLCLPHAPVAELVDALDSKSSSARSAGSIPARGTIANRQADRPPFFSL